MSYSSVLAALSPVWSSRLHDASGTTLTDGSGGGHNGTYGAGVTLNASGATSDGDKAITLPGGTTGESTVATGTYLNAAAAWSAVIWVKYTSTSTMFAFTRSTATTAYNWLLGVSGPSATGTATMRTTAGVFTATGATNIRDGNWHMIAGTWDGTNVRIYIDGILDGASTVTTGTGDTSARGLRLGGRVGDSWTGGLDEPAMFTYALTGTQISNLYAAGIVSGVGAGAAPVINISAATAAILGLAVGASKTVTISTTAAAALGVRSGAAETISISAATAAVLGLRTGAAPVLTVTVDADGDVHVPGHGDVDSELDITVTTAAALGLRTGAAETISISTAAAGALGFTGGADIEISIGVEATSHVHGEGDGEADVVIDLTIDVVASGVVLVPAETQLTFGDGGRRRDGIATADFEEAEVTPPWSVASSIRRIAAHAIDDFTVTGPLPSDMQVSFRTVIATQGHYRILVGGKDVTYFRGVPTPEPTWQLLSPGLYGPGALAFPQIKAALERPGHGALDWLQKWAKVVVKVKTGATWHVVYRGYITDDDRSGGDYSCTLGGELSGPASTMYRPPRVYTYKRDLAALVNGMLTKKLHLDAHTPDDTGIVVVDTGGQSQWDWLSQTMANSTTLGGNQWTVMPDTDGRYRLRRKNTDTVHYSLYVDDAHVHADLRRDYTEEDNRVFADATDPDGLRINFAVIPGLSGDSSKPAYPMAGDADMPPGTTDADTVSGAGVTTLIWRLFLLGYLDEKHDTWDDEVTRAVKRAQRAADLDIVSVGIVTPPFWAALWDGDRTGYAMRGAHIEPAAQRPQVHKYRRNATGQIIGFNPRYDRSVKIVDRIVHMGVGKTQGQVADWSHNSLDDGTPNYVGTIDVPMGALISGEHHPGDPLDGSMLVDSRLARPNENVYLANFDGGTLVHITGVSYSGTAVQLTVDTRARDTQEVWDVIDRNRASRVSLGRVWVKDNLSSGTTRDQMAVWDKFGGVVDDTWHLPGHTWSIIPVRAGREGQVRNLRISLVDNPPEFSMAAFGRHISPARLNQLVGNPLTEDGRRNWRRRSDTLVNDHVMIYSAGTDQNPLGYHPTTKPDAAADFPAESLDAVRTGKWHDDGGFAYHTFGEPVIWMALYPDRDCKLEPGRLFTVQLSDQV